MQKQEMIIILEIAKSSWQNDFLFEVEQIFCVIAGKKNFS